MGRVGIYGEKDLTYVLAKATHHRHKLNRPAPDRGSEGSNEGSNEPIPFSAKFAPIVAMVGVPLPKDEGRFGGGIDTRIGRVNFDAHLIPSLNSIAGHPGWEKAFPDITPGAATLYTTADAVGGPFTAMAIYVCREHESDLNPSAVILQPGLRRNAFKTLHFGRPNHPFENRAGYVATPASRASNIHRGLFIPDESGRPKQLTISARIPEDTDPYITVTLDFKPDTNPTPLTNAFLPARAMLYMAALGAEMLPAIGKRAKDFSQLALAALGTGALHLLPWEKRPGVDKPNKG